MSDTPRTDAAEIPTDQYGSITAAAVCRQLERELNAATRSLSEAVTFQLQARTAETLDAERYRYLRNAAGMCEAGPSVCSGLSDLFEYHWGPEVDEVVDEAIADWKARGCPLPKEAA